MNITKRLSDLSDGDLQRLQAAILKEIKHRKELAEGAQAIPGPLTETVGDVQYRMRRSGVATTAAAVLVIGGQESGEDGDSAAPSKAALRFPAAPLAPPRGMIKDPCQLAVCRFIPPPLGLPGKPSGGGRAFSIKSTNRKPTALRLSCYFSC